MTPLEWFKDVDDNYQRIAQIRREHEAQIAQIGDLQYQVNILTLRIRQLELEAQA